MKQFSTALAALLVSAGAQAAPMVIDDFSGPTITAAAPPAAAGVAFGTASGGYARTLTTTASGNFVDTSINAVATPGTFAHSQGSGILGSSALSFAMGGIDLTVDTNALRIELEATDLNGVIGITVFDGANSATVNLTTNQILIASGLAFPAYADYLFSGFGGVDFTSVDSITLTIDGTMQDALDARISTFGSVCSALTVSGGAGGTPGNGNCTPVTVPEPTSLALVGLALAGLGVASRRRKV